MSGEAMFWLIAMIAFMVVEAGTAALVSVWFAAGALAALVVAMLGGILPIQIVVFLVVSIVLLCILRGFARKYVDPHIVHTNVNSVVGTTGVVSQAVNNLTAEGRVTIDGMDWSARSSTGEALPQGATVRIDRVEGVKVFVSLAEVSAVK